MKIFLSNHAKYRSTERGVDISMIKEVIKNPLKINVQSEGQKRVEGMIKGRKTIVVYQEKVKEKFVIITVI
ncbi:MAG: hypothetical protein ACI9GH_000465 [Candidatus Paceibacteria bacterium]|jgi:hypothetical protein